MPDDPTSPVTPPAVETERPYVHLVLNANGSVGFESNMSPMRAFGLIEAAKFTMMDTLKAQAAKALIGAAGNGHNGKGLADFMRSLKR